jgi:hypothetical protein
VRSSRTRLFGSRPAQAVDAQRFVQGKAVEPRSLEIDAPEKKQAGLLQGPMHVAPSTPKEALFAGSRAFRALRELLGKPGASIESEAEIDGRRFVAWKPEKVQATIEHIFGSAIDARALAEIAAAPAASEIRLQAKAPHVLAIVAEHPDHGKHEVTIRALEGEPVLIAHTASEGWPGAAPSPKKLQLGGVLHKKGPVELGDRSFSEAWYSTVRDEKVGSHTFRCLEPERANQVTKALFGHALKPKEIADLVAAPHGSKIELWADEEKGTLKVHVENKLYDSYAETFSRDEKGRLTGKIDLWEVNKWVAPSGTGTKYFALHVEAAKRFGLRRITLDAVGPDSSLNPEASGHIAWPLMGFNAPLGEEIRAKLPKQLASATCLNELMLIPGGIAWWKQNAVSGPMVFSLDPGSTALRVLDERLELLEQRRAAKEKP